MYDQCIMWIKVNQKCRFEDFEKKQNLSDKDNSSKTTTIINQLATLNFILFNQQN